MHSLKAILHIRLQRGSRALFITPLVADVPPKDQVFFLGLHALAQAQLHLVGKAEGIGALGTGQPHLAFTTSMPRSVCSHCNGFDHRSLLSIRTAVEAGTVHGLAGIRAESSGSHGIRPHPCQYRPAAGWDRLIHFCHPWFSPEKLPSRQEMHCCGKSGASAAITGTVLGLSS